MTIDCLPLSPDSFLDQLAREKTDFTSDPERFPDLAAYLQLQECANGQGYFGLIMTVEYQPPIFLALYRGSTHWHVLPVFYDLSEKDYAITIKATLEQTLGRHPSPLMPCPFCGYSTPCFERIGTPWASCIVVCEYCGGGHESSDKDAHNGRSWNRRSTPPHLTDALARLQSTAYLDSAVSVQARTEDLKAVLTYFGIGQPANKD